MSSSLIRRLEALEDKVPGASTRPFVTWRRHNLTPQEESEFDVMIAARHAAYPRQQIIIVSWES